MAHEIFILKSKTLKVHENAIKLSWVMKCNLMGFSCYWKMHHENYHQIFMVLISWDFNDMKNSWPLKNP